MFIRILVFLCITSLGWAQSSKIESLRGLRAISVVIEDLGPDEESLGLTKSRLQTRVELRLRRSGITVLEDAIPFLYVNINVKKTSTGLYAVATEVSLKQQVYLVRDSSIEITGVTWNVASVGTVGENRLARSILDHVGKYVDEFANDYLAANPRYPDSIQKVES